MSETELTPPAGRVNTALTPRPPTPTLHALCDVQVYYEQGTLDSNSSHCQDIMTRLHAYIIYHKESLYMIAYRDCIVTHEGN